MDLVGRLEALDQDEPLPRPGKAGAWRVIGNLFSFSHISVILASG